MTIHRWTRTTEGGDVIGGVHSVDGTTSVIGALEAFRKALCDSTFEVGGAWVSVDVYKGLKNTGGPQEEQAPETPDDWERENQAAMIEAVKPRGKE